MDVSSIVAVDGSNAAPRTPPRGDGADDGADENGAADGDGEEMPDEDSGEEEEDESSSIKKRGRRESGTGPQNLTLKSMLKFWAL